MPSNYLLTSNSENEWCVQRYSLIAIIYPIHHQLFIARPIHTHTATHINKFQARNGQIRKMLNVSNYPNKINNIMYVHESGPNVPSVKVWM